MVLLGKNLVFAMTIKLIHEFWKNPEIPEKIGKTYDQHPAVDQRS